MVTYAHPLVSASLVVITCTVLISNVFFGSNSADESFPEYKPRPTLAESRRHARMIGNWVGESSIESGGQRRILMQQFADGTFRLTFKTQREDQVDLERQVGQWGIAGPVYFTITTGWLQGERIEPTDLGQPYFYDAYRIVELERNVFEYESFASPRRYRLQRVADDFSESDL